MVKLAIHRFVHLIRSDQLTGMCGARGVALVLRLAFGFIALVRSFRYVVAIIDRVLTQIWNRTRRILMQNFQVVSVRLKEHFKTFIDLTCQHHAIPNHIFTKSVCSNNRT